MAFNIFLLEIRFFRRRGEGLSDVLPESMIVVAVGDRPWGKWEFGEDSFCRQR
jgi:hypothetical protein